MFWTYSTSTNDTKIMKIIFLIVHCGLQHSLLCRNHEHYHIIKIQGIEARTGLHLHFDDNKFFLYINEHVFFLTSINLFMSKCGKLFFILLWKQPEIELKNYFSFEYLDVLSLRVKEFFLLCSQFDVLH